jgi:hypothetical protein
MPGDRVSGEGSVFSGRHYSVLICETGRPDCYWTSERAKQVNRAFRTGEYVPKHITKVFRL